MPNDKVTVGEWLDRWIQSRRKIRRATRVSYQGHMNNYLRPHLGEIKPSHAPDAPLAAAEGVWTA
jgi:hypothetical protein